MTTESFHMEDLVRYAPLLLSGLGHTMTLAVLVLASAFILAMTLAILRYWRTPVMAQVCDVVVYLIRSIPAIMLIALVHFGILPLLGIRDNVFLSAYVALTLYTAVYMAEILRGGFSALHREEVEAAVSLGLTARQRMIHILAPLAVMRMLPALVNQSVTLIKDTSLASIIGVIELTRSAEIVYERTLHEATLLAVIALVYFLLCFTLSQLARHLTCRFPLAYPVEEVTI